MGRRSGEKTRHNTKCMIEVMKGSLKHIGQRRTLQRALDKLRKNPPD